jgi:alkylation response protein AidB-like acyl-CoA dehydrogenase
MLVLEEMGRVNLISPYFTTLALGASTIIEAASPEQKQMILPPLAEGKLKLTLAVPEPDGIYGPEGIRLKATRQDGSYILEGIKMFVPEAESADYLICAARTAEGQAAAEGISLFLVKKNLHGISLLPLKTISGERQCRVEFTGVKVPADFMLGEDGKGWHYLAKAIARGAVARCAEMIGGAKKVLEMTLNYAKERVAFGHPIGAYQSIQHRCADMLIDLEGARVVTYQAGWALNSGLPAEDKVAIAKAWTNQAYRRIVTSAHQVHGAIGFTMDHVLHWYTRRARAQEFSFGGIDYFLDQLVKDVEIK